MDTNLNLKITNSLICDFMKDTEYLNYSDDWNLIMNVVIKINNIEININLPEESDGWYAYYALEASLPLADKEMTLRNIIKFINWYNNYENTSR